MIATLIGLTGFVALVSGGLMAFAFMGADGKDDGHIRTLVALTFIFVFSAAACGALLLARAVA